MQKNVANLLYVKDSSNKSNLIQFHYQFVCYLSQTDKFFESPAVIKIWNFRLKSINNFICLLKTLFNPQLQLDAESFIFFRIKSGKLRSLKSKKVDLWRIIHTGYLHSGHWHNRMKSKCLTLNCWLHAAFIANVLLYHLQT